MHELVVLGSLNRDLTAELPHLPETGQTVRAVALREGCGGKGANQALAAARFGAHVVLIGAVGREDGGDQLCERLALEGVDVSGVRSTAGRSGTALIFVAANSENFIAIAPGANDQLAAHDVLGATQHLGCGDVLLCQLEVPVEVVEAAAVSAKSRGAIVILNAAPAQQLGQRLLSAIDILVVNEGEAAVLTGTPSAPWPWAAQAAAELLMLGPPTVAVTMGSRGVALATSSQTTHIPAFAVDAVDSVGAGDAFVGALAAEIAGGQDLLTAVRLGTAAGALAVTRRGAQDAMPTRDEVQSLLDGTGPQQQDGVLGAS